MNIPNFFGELKRRNVYKVAAAYAVAGWALAQGIAQVLPIFNISNSAVRLIVLLIVIGFPVAIILAWALELTPEGIKRAKDVDPAAQGSSRNHAWIYVVIVGGTLAIGLFFLGRYTVPNRNGGLEGALKSIAVLPFKPVTPEDRDQVLEMGMADTLISKLSGTREIVVPSLTSVRKYIALDQDPMVAGRELQVESVLEGNVQKSGDHIRVTARLISVADGSSLWAGTFDEKFTDVFAVQDAISQKTADALALKLDKRSQKRLTKRDTQNVEAYQLYLTGRYHFARLIPSEIRTAIGFFQQAIDKDPNYALAYFGLAEANRSLAITADVPSKDCLPQAKAAAMKALEIDDSLAEAHASLSFILIWFDWNWAGAEKEAKRAVALNPNSAMAHFAYAHILSDLGRHQEAVAQVTRARELDPLFLLVRSLEGMFFHHAGRNDEALVSLRIVLDLDPNFWITHLILGKVYLQQRKYPEAITEFSNARELSHGNSEAIASIGYTFALAGDKAKARDVLEELKAVSKPRYVPPVNIALVCDGLGDQNEAFSWLEKACQERDVRLTLLKVDPRWDSFRSNPRFAAILERIGLK